MCGRFVLKSIEGIAGRFRLRWVGVPTRRVEISEWTGEIGSYNTRPTNTVAAVTNPDGERQLEPMRWGLIPFWWRESSPPKFATFNARNDRLTSGTWREPVKRSRCLVPAHGFYEWTGPKGRRIPHDIHRIDGEILAFAGLADTWANPETGEALWIDPGTTRIEDVEHLVAPYEWAGMADHVVPPLRGDGPHLIEPAATS